MLKIKCPICNKSWVSEESPKGERRIKDVFNEHFSTHYTWNKKQKGSKTQK